VEEQKMETTMRQAILDSDSAAVAVEAPNANNLAATKTWRMTGSEVTELKALDQAVEEYMKQHSVPGGAIAVARNGKLIFARGYSWSEPTQETTSPTSLFRIASCTKPLTRIGIHKLIENHSLALTDNVQSILQLTLPNGAKPTKDPKPADLETDGYYFNEVQVDHLMRHSGGWDREKSGFNEPTFFKDMEVAQAFSKGLPVTREEIARWGTGQKMQFWPGFRYAYSNFGFSLLGLVIERKTGSDYISWMRDKIFAPLGVTRPRLGLPLELSRAPEEVAYTAQDGRLTADFVTGIGSAPIQYGGENNANFASFGGWVMSAPDYVRILASYAPGQTPPTQTHFKDMAGAPRGNHGGVACTEHGGGMPGTTTYIALRDDEIAIAVFFNEDAPPTMTWKGATRDAGDVWHEVLNAVTKWPTNDQFPAVMTKPVPPGPERLDVFATDLDGLVSQAAWEANVASARWRGWWPIDNIVANFGSPSVAVTRDSNHLDLFVTGKDGKAYTAGWAAAIADQAWRGWWDILGGLVPAGGTVTAVARTPNKLDAFVVSGDGFVYTAAWESGVNNNAWAGWWRIGSLQAKPGSIVTAVSRDANKLDIFVAGNDGKAYTAAWDADVPGGWRGWWDILGGLVPAGGAVTAVARTPNKLDVFVVSGDAFVYTAAWEGGVNNNAWAGWWRIGSLQAKPGSVVTAVSRDANKLDLFVAGSDGKTYTAAWDANIAGGWRGWWTILTGAIQAGGVITAVSRAPNKLDAFHVGNDGGVYTAAWEGGVNQDQWAGWWRIGELKSVPGARVSVVTRKLS
jgi:CubicO group peptidase (beta-lactamase class C family)